MAKLLFVEDSAICREPIAAMLRNRGYEVICAVDGEAALSAIAADLPDLILLDVAMPRMDGLCFMKYLRGTQRGKDVPVILLTAASDKEIILRAKALGAQEYLLKSHFSLTELLARVRKHLPPELTSPSLAGRPMMADAGLAAKPTTLRASGDITSRSSPSAALMTPAPNTPRGGPSPAKVKASTIDIPRLLDREATVKRMEMYGESKTLAGVVAEVITLASSPRGTVSDLVHVLRRDPLLATRVLHVANSAAFASAKPRISTIEEAVRNVGVSAVRNVAATVGVFAAFPPDTSDGFNSVRCWQHCFAVAAIMDRFQISGMADAGIGHVVGLCHDLGEIVFRQHFACEYGTAVRLAGETGKPLREIENIVFGAPHDELVGILLEKLGLPPVIINPIKEYSEYRLRATATGFSPMAQALRLADHYAHGLLLASSTDATIFPFRLSDCRGVFGDVVPEIDDTVLRAEVLSTTNLLARLNAADEERLSLAILPRSQAGVWYVRQSGFSHFDPVSAALKLLATKLEIHNRLPETPEEFAGCHAVIIATPRPDITTVAVDQAKRFRHAVGNNQIPILYLSGKSDDQQPALPPGISLLHYPISLARLASVLEDCITTAGKGLPASSSIPMVGAPPSAQAA